MLVTSTRVTTRVTSTRVTSTRVTSTRVTSARVTSARVTSARVTSTRVTSTRVTSARLTSRVTTRCARHLRSRPGWCRGGLVAAGPRGRRRVGFAAEPDVPHCAAKERHDACTPLCSAGMCGVACGLRPHCTLMPQNGLSLSLSLSLSLKVRCGLRLHRCLAMECAPSGSFAAPGGAKRGGGYSAVRVNLCTLSWLATR